MNTTVNRRTVRFPTLLQHTPVTNPLLSVVIPVYNEVDNVDPLVHEIGHALSGVAHEIVYVDDGSSDGTVEKLTELEQQIATLRVIVHPQNAGQSAAFCTGVRAARGKLIATLDGDGQNDPADIPKLLELHNGSPMPVLVAGARAKRNDSFVRRASSRIANHVRSRILKDGCLDTGCSLKLFRRDLYLLLPQFNHMHRFFPALFAREGVGIINVPVTHRPRSAGESKYGVGNRLWVGIADMFGVRWLIKRGFRLSGIDRLSFNETVDE